MINIANWSKSKIFINQTLNHLISFGKCNMHLNGALTVPNIVNFLSSNGIDILEDSRKIVVSHMLEGELPKFFVFIRVVFGMVARMLVTSAITEPYIISAIGKHKAWSFILIIDKPSIRAI